MVKLILGLGQVAGDEETTYDESSADAGVCGAETSESETTSAAWRKDLGG